MLTLYRWNFPVDFWKFQPVIINEHVGDLLSIPAFLKKRQLEGQILPHYLRQPHELKLREEELDGVNQEVASVNFNKEVILDKSVLDLKGTTFIANLITPLISGNSLLPSLLAL